MRKLIIASAAGLLLGTASLSAMAAPTADECQSKFQTADANKDGVLQSDEAKLYLDAIGKAQFQLHNASVITREEFVGACQKDIFASVAPNASDKNTSTQAKSTNSTDTSQTTASAKSGNATTGTATNEQTASTTKPAAGADQGIKTTEEALAQSKGFLASKLIGSTVYTKDDQSIGDINDLIVASDSKVETGVVIGIGGFLGMGEKNVVMDMSRLSIVPTDNGGAKIVLDTTKSELESMPAYTTQ